MVKHYIEEFENLSNKVHSFDMEFKVETFVVGLKDELQHKVSPFKPWIVIDAKNLALQQESKSIDLHKTFFHPQCLTDCLLVHTVHGLPVFIISP